MKKTIYTSTRRQQTVAMSYEGVKSMTDQSFRDKVSMKSIMEKYKKHGVILDVNRNYKNPSFGDFASIPNFQEVRNLMISADEQFLQLNSKIRERFGNNVESMIAFLKDEKNRKEAEELGLIEPKKPEIVQKVEIVEKVSKKASEEPKKGD